MQEMNKAWITRGFESFRKGSFGNAGHNLYVSRAGVLQRIHQYDLNRNGYFDLVFCNSQAHWERVPAYVFRDLFGSPIKTELIAEGAIAAAIADLNGDGMDDLVIGCLNNGVTTAGLNAHIYYGCSEGWSERYQTQLPAPDCMAVAVGRFDGKKPAIAFGLPDHLRLFFQTELGFEPKRFTDLQIRCESAYADDLDGDGYDDLIVRMADGTTEVYWGSRVGLSPSSRSIWRLPEARQGGLERPADGENLAEYVEDAVSLVRTIDLGRPYIFAPSSEAVFLVPAEPNRSFGEPLRLSCPHCMAAAAGDINGDGFVDLVVAGRDTDGSGTERSWIYWGGVAGFGESNRTSFVTHRACDVSVGDIDGDGCDDIVVCQNRTNVTFSTESLVYRGTRSGISDEPMRFETHDARRAFVAYPCGAGIPEVVFVNHFAGTASDTVKSTIYYGSEDGYSPERRQDIPGSGAVEAICCDINDDGSPDIVLVNASEYTRAERDPGSYVLFNRDGRFPERPNIVLPTVHAHGGCCADVNRDGYLDLVFGGFGNPELLVFYGGPDGFDPTHPVRIRMEKGGVTFNEPRWIYLADLNNDGWLDLVVPQIEYDRSFILWGGPDGFSMERIQFLSVFHACCVRAADLTGNGYLDLIVGGHRQSFSEPADSFVYIYWNGPDGLREDRKMLLPANAVNSMTLGDFNGDGLLDLFVGSYAGPRERDVHSFIYWNRRGRGYSAEDRSRLFTHSASGCVACDFDGDGRVDLAVANHKVDGNHVGWSAVWWNGPQGFSESNVTSLPTAGPHGMTCIGPGSILDRGPEEYYESAPHEVPAGAHATRISWEADVPKGTWVRAQMRLAADPDGLKAAPWTGASGSGSWVEDGRRIPVLGPPGGWMQYRLALGATHSLNTPRVTEVSVAFGRK